MTDQTKPKFLRLPVVLERTGLSRTMLYSLLAREDFPVPIKLAKRAIAWYESDVEGWMAQRPRVNAPIFIRDEGEA